jgi:hypothetical protein
VNDGDVLERADGADVEDYRAGLEVGNLVSGEGFGEVEGFGIGMC